MLRHTKNYSLKNIGDVLSCEITVAFCKDHRTHVVLICANTRVRLQLANQTVRNLCTCMKQIETPCREQGTIWMCRCVCMNCVQIARWLHEGKVIFLFSELMKLLYAYSLGTRRRDTVLPNIIGVGGAEYLNKYFVCPWLIHVCANVNVATNHCSNDRCTLVSELKRK